jgi:hypothetical protein
MCLSEVPENQVPFPKPEGYTAKRYELLARLIPANTRGDFNFGNPEWSGLEGFGSTGNNFANFLLGLPRQKARRPGDHTSYLRATEYGGFVQDDFKFNSRLTMNLGLRYQLYISPKENRNNISAMRLRIRPTSFAEGGINLCKDPARCAAINPNLAPLALGLTLNDLRVDRLPQVVVAGQDGVPRSLVQLDKLNFGPRVGFAFRIAEDYRPISRVEGSSRRAMASFFFRSNIRLTKRWTARLAQSQWARGARLAFGRS